MAIWIKAKSVLLITAMALLAAPMIARATTFMWIGAHPDDEQYVAGTFGNLCVVDPANHVCKMLVMTRGENGSCALPGGCLPDVETVRVQEMTNAASIFEIFGANLAMGYLDDIGGTPQDVVNRWATQAGGYSQLVNTVKNHITNNGVQTIFTMHPDIGVYCHAAHRATGMIVLDAVDQLAFDRSRVWLVTQRQINTGNPTYVKRIPSFSPNPKELKIDINPTYGYLINDLAAHPSQYTQTALDAFSATPSNERNEYLMKYSDFVSSTLCP